MSEEQVDQAVEQDEKVQEYFSALGGTKKLVKDEDEQDNSDDQDSSGDEHGDDDVPF